MGKKLVFLCLFFILAGCQSQNKDPLKYGELLTPYGDTIKTRLAITDADQQQGLSGIRDQDFDDNEGMLFVYAEEGDRAFWMPDTYFDLDLIYMNPELVVVDIIRKLPHYIGRENPDRIPRARPVWAMYVLEMKSASEIAKKIKLKDQLRWSSSLSLQQIESKIHPRQ